MDGARWTSATRPRRDCGGFTLDEVYKLAAKELKESEKDLRARYRHLNPGMQRMNLGNRMRAAAKAAKGAK